jgi:hypothetical protein
MTKRKASKRQKQQPALGEVQNIALQFIPFAMVALAIIIIASERGAL